MAKTNEAAPVEGKIEISLLGGFNLKIGETLISDSASRTHQLWNLLEYLIAYRKKTVPQEELMEALWPEGSIENPANALKNLVYRIRTTLTTAGVPGAKEIICYRHGTYHWNNKLDSIVDTEEFERSASIAEAYLDVETRIGAYKQALAFYKGDFLPGSSFEQWVIPLASYYRTLYFRCVYTVCDLLREQRRFAEMQEICEKAIRIDPLEERANRLLIQSFIGQENSTAALEHYNYITDLCYRELGVKPSEELRSLYREITKSVNSVETDINVIKDDLAEQSSLPGAFYCDYEVFRNLYRIEARGAVRSGQSVYIALVTVTDREDKIPQSDIYNKVMDQLLKVVQLSLRRGDIISRFSATQYVAMMQSLTFENGQMVLERIARNFKQLHRRDDVKLHTILQPLEPVDD